MKRTAMLLAVLCSFAVTLAEITSAQKLANVAGRWEVTIRMPDGAVTEQWSIRQSGGKITGTAKGTRGELPVTGTVEGAFLRVEVKDGDMQYKVRATVDNDAMDGSITLGRSREYLWFAKRPKAK